MNALLEQFLSESRDFLQGIGEKLMQLEDEPNNTEFMVELFRFVHTLKGNSGLFDFPEMTRVLHASEDLMDSVRNGQVNYSQALADQLLEAMDFVSVLVDEIEATGELSNQYADTSAALAKALRALIVGSDADTDSQAVAILLESSEVLDEKTELNFSELVLPESVAMQTYRNLKRGDAIIFMDYTPDPECFFKGEDPFFLVRQIPEVIWSQITTANNAPLAQMDAYDCRLTFQMLTSADASELRELFRYVPEDVRFETLTQANSLIVPVGEQNDAPVYDDFIEQAKALLMHQDVDGLCQLTGTMLELSSPDLWSSSALRWLLLVLEIDASNTELQQALIESLRTFSLQLDLIEPLDVIESLSESSVQVSDSHAQTTASTALDNTPLTPEEQVRVNTIINSQKEILNLPNTHNAWLEGRLKAVALTLKGCCQALHKNEALENLDEALNDAINQSSSEPLLVWLEIYHHDFVTVEASENTQEIVAKEIIEEEIAKPIALKATQPEDVPEKEASPEKDASPEIKFNRRTEDANAGASKTLKVDQEKIDRLMNLIGEMVVAKNALPYLANRAETVFGVRELSREIKAQYAVINRVAEEMQDTIMQVRMMPVSFIFQRFPRMVRDISRKLGKEVHLVLEGETTEADKNIIEALADPLIHIVRNSLDHGLEMPDVRKAAGKPAEGKLLIRASQESDRVLIEIIDDGKGIDPNVIKNKAYEKGLIDEAMLERISDQDAVNLVFAAGFSTADVISDLSGRGVGMDVVRSAVEKVNGTVGIESQTGKGTRLFLSLPLSMAVTNVMIIESNKQIFGVPMDMVVETVRVPFDQIRNIKQKQTTVLRGRIVPLLSLNELLAQNVEQVANEDNELATLIVRVHGENVGILVDDFRETVDIILKPMTGILGGLGGYSGAALLGDGSVLMVLNPRELI
jgi:two-component system chemotaxis sensor kinase CheA